MTRYWGIGKIIAVLVVAIGFIQIIPLGLALWDGSRDIFPFVWSICISVFTGGAFFAATHKISVTSMKSRDAFVVVTLSWVTVCLTGSIPFILQPEFGSFTNAYFESASGFTTTGSTILTNIEALPRATLLWRSLIQWLGGMGIIVLSLAILPLLNVGGLKMFGAEVPGPTADRLQPKIRDTASLLWKVYAIITFALFLLLWIGGFDWFDSICHAFTTMATGGFGTKNDSMMTMGNPFTEGVVTVFMFLAGINFALHYSALFKGQWKTYFQDAEFRYYCGLIGILIVVFVAALTWHGQYSFLESIRYGAFQVLSLTTTTGYNSADFEQWALAIPLIGSLCLMCLFVGGMSGSTGGGIKTIRWTLAFKLAYRELFRLIHPRAVKPVRLGNAIIKDSVISSVTGFLLLFVLIFIAIALILAAQGADLVTAFSAAASAIGNVGPGLGELGPTDNYSALPDLSKWTLVLGMFFGRLEIYTVLLLFIPEYWRK